MTRPTLMVAALVVLSFLPTSAWAQRGIIAQDVLFGGQPLDYESRVLSDTKVWRTSGCWEDVAGTPTQVTTTPVPAPTGYLKIVPIVGDDRVILATMQPGQGQPRLDGLKLEIGGCEAASMVLDVPPDVAPAANFLRFAMSSTRLDRPAIVSSSEGLLRVDLGATSPTLEPWLSADEIWRKALEASGDLPLEGRASGRETVMSLTKVNAFYAPDGKLWVALVTSVDSDVVSARIGFGWVLRFDGDTMEVILNPEQIYRYTKTSGETGMTMRPIFELGVVELGRRAVPLTGTPQQIRDRAMVVDTQVQSYSDGQGRRYFVEGTTLKRIAFDPDVADIDYDGLLLREELALGTSDGNFDSDFDGRPDAAEVLLGTDPTSPQDEAYAGPTALGLSSSIMDWSVLRVHEVTDDGVEGGIDVRSFWMDDAAPLPGGVCQYGDGAPTGGWHMTCFALLGDEIGSYAFGRRPPSFDADGQTIWVQPEPGATYEPWSVASGAPTGGDTITSQAESGELVAGLNGLMHTDGTGTPQGIEIFEDGTPRWIAPPDALNGLLLQFEFVGRDTIHGFDLFRHTVPNGRVFAFDGDVLRPVLGTQYLARNDQTGTIADAVSIAAIRTLPDKSGYVVFFNFEPGTDFNGALTLQSAYQFLDRNFAIATPGLVGHQIAVQQWAADGWLASYRYRRRIAVTFNGTITCVSSSAGTVCQGADETREVAINNPEAYAQTYQQAVPTTAGLEPGDILLADANGSLWKHGPTGATTMFMPHSAITRQLGIDPGIPMAPRAMAVAPDLREVCIVDQNQRIVLLALAQDHTPDRITSTDIIDVTTCGYDATGGLHWVSTSGDVMSAAGAMLNVNGPARSMTQVADRWIIHLEDNAALCVRDGVVEGRLASATGVGVDHATNTVIAADPPGSVRAFSLDDFCTGELNRGHLVFGTKLATGLWFNLYFFANRSIRPSDTVNVAKADVATFGLGHIVVLPRELTTTSYQGTTPSLLFRLLPTYVHAQGDVKDAAASVTRGRDYFHRASEITFRAMTQVPGVGAAPADYYDVDAPLVEETPDMGNGPVDMGQNPASGGDDGGCATGAGGGAQWPLLLIAGLWWRRRRWRR
ncbi:MAG: hypothetical protein R3E66_04395 [bacterium]